MEDDRIASSIAAHLGVQSVTVMYRNDWYARNDGWTDELPDLAGADDD
jgi:sigma54-dependent transcription regulator